MPKLYLFGIVFLLSVFAGADASSFSAFQPALPLQHSHLGSSERTFDELVLFGKRGGKGGGKVQKDRIKKTDLPEKICVVCGRPFTWRKKWERCWDEVTCCSKSCNAKRRGPD
mmetsp:Transcript_46507/g.68745  ORF Transcript_46507/g.68745 Transcript_46507/m.68745 type:complete len:113 (-) Transcript_46507:69-407(-)